MTTKKYRTISGFYRVKDVSELFGISYKTLVRWDKSEKLKSQRHPINGQRIYRKDYIDSILESLMRKNNV
jgi:DNA-binding transcriptional MerR regulator